VQDFLNQIKSGIDQDLYYLALFTSLAIPDICGALTTNDGIARKCGYIKWFDTYVAIPKKYRLQGIDCYYFRCSMLHQGTTTHTSSTFSKILFIEPNNKFRGNHNIFLRGTEKVLNIDVVDFCNDIIESTRNWFNQIQSNDNFKKNYDKFIRRHETGLPPYISGIPVIG